MFSLSSSTSFGICGTHTGPAGSGERKLLWNPGDNLTYSVWMRTIDGAPTLDWMPYPIQMTVIDGAPTTSDIPVVCPDGNFDTILGDDGMLYDLSVLNDGVNRTLHWTRSP